MPKRTHVEHEKAIRELQAYVTPSGMAKQFQCHARMIERLISGSHQRRMPRFKSVSKAPSFLFTFPKISRSPK